LSFINPYKKVPKSAPKSTKIIGKNPAPSNINIGPGQEPTKAQPNPKNIPPIQNRVEPASLGIISMG